jgi:4-hydroxymandelate oxidase
MSSAGAGCPSCVDSASDTRRLAAAAAAGLALGALGAALLLRRRPPPLPPPLHPRPLVCLADYERAAAARLAPGPWAYFSSGAGDQHTQRANAAALALRVALRPRVLVDVSAASCAHTLLGRACAQPWGLAPTAFHGLAHGEAEGATARAAARAGVPYCVSASASLPLEATAPAGGRRLWQMYYLRSRASNARLLARAEAAGMEAVVLTVDRPVLGLRDEVARQGFTLPGRTPGDADANACAGGEALSDALCWQDVAWLRAATRLPLVLKGVLTAEDAAAAVRAGVAGVWVSTHGGRQLDGGLSSAEALVEVVAAVRAAEAERDCSSSSGSGGGARQRTAVWVDGGVRRGTDVVKYLALGADFVWLGQPVLWGLAVGGEEGLLALLRVLGSEVRNALQLCGLRSPAEVSAATALWRAG